jgi:Tol biopolymer transport system component
MWCAKGRADARATARAALTARRGGRRRSLRVAAALWLCVGMGDLLESRAHAAFPGTNGVIAYSWPDPMADLAYLAFAHPNGAVASKWVASWDGTEVGEPAFSPDGTRIAASFEGRNQNAVAVGREPASKLRVITHPHGDDLDRSPGWSPDGQSVVFERSDGHLTDQLLTVRADGRGLRRLGRGEYPAWSTGGQILFTRFRHHGDWTSLFTVSAAGGPARRLTYGHADIGGDWSPDGQRVVFERFGEIYTVDVASRQPQRLTHCTHPCGDPSYSPDGTQIVYAMGRKLFVIPAAGGPTLATFRCDEPSCYGTDWLPAPLF